MNMIKLMDLEEITTPRNGYRAVVDHWWMQNEDGKILDWVVGKHRSIQANRDQKVAEYLIAKNPHYKGCTALFVPLAFYPFQE